MSDTNTVEAPQVAFSASEGFIVDMQAQHIQAAEEAVDTTFALAAGDATSTAAGEQTADDPIDYSVDLAVYRQHPVETLLGDMATLQHARVEAQLQENAQALASDVAVASFPVTAVISQNEETGAYAIAVAAAAEFAGAVAFDPNHIDNQGVVVSVTELDPSNLTGDGTVTPLPLTKKQRRAMREQAGQQVESQGELSAQDKLTALADKFGKKLINKSDQPPVLRQGPKQPQRPRPAPAAVEIPAARRQVASLLTEFIQAKHVTGLNAEEGVDHINIGVSSTAIGRALDPYSRQKNRATEWINFTHSQLGEFACIASMIFFLKSPEGEDRDSWRTQWSQPLRKRSEKGEFSAVRGLKLFVADAYWQLLQQNPWMAEQLVKTDLPLTMYFYFGKDSVRRQAREASWLIPILDAIRTALKAKEEYPDFNFLDINEAI